jgi:hypothetical protein
MQNLTVHCLCAQKINAFRKQPAPNVPEDPMKRTSQHLRTIKKQGETSQPMRDAGQLLHEDMKRIPLGGPGKFVPLFPSPELAKKGLAKGQSPCMVDIMNCKTNLVSRIKSKLTAAQEADEAEANAPANKKRKKERPVPRTRHSSLPGENETDRRARVRRESATRRERDQQQRAMDRARQRMNAANPPEARPHWREPPPQKPTDRDETAVERMQRVDRYFARLEELASSFHTCRNCWERDCDHITTAEDEFCCRCIKPDKSLTQYGKKRAESNGLQLCVTGDAKWQREWAELKNGCPADTDPERHENGWQLYSAPASGWGELSPTEEALISPVLTMTAVLHLPSGKQLGYRGSVINFVNETASVAQQLPRTPEDANIIVYRVRGNKGTHKDMRVRRGAIRDHLLFFARHHKIFKDGIRDPYRDGAWVVRPFKEEEMISLLDGHALNDSWFDGDALNALPVDGIPADDFFDLHDMEEEEAADQPLASDAESNDDSGDEDAAPAAKTTDPSMRVVVRASHHIAQQLKLTIYASLTCAGQFALGDVLAPEWHRLCSTGHALKAGVRVLT